MSCKSSVQQIFKDFNKNVFVIAEIGINHEGNIKKCFELIDSAHNSGADAIKIQTINPDENYSRNNESFSIFSKARLTDDETIAIFNYCKKKKIRIFTTVGDFKTLNLISKLSPFAYKISSGLLNNTPLLLEILKKNKPTIISTGIAINKDLIKLKKIINKKFKEICIMHCVSLYPTPHNLIGMNYINYLENYFKCPIGYSDHTNDYLIPSYAVVSGAVIIEKHFTFDINREGFDHHISFDNVKFKKMVNNIRRVEKILPVNELLIKKKEIRNKFARFIVANQDLKKNQIINFKDLGFKRVKDMKVKGIEPSEVKYFLGKRVNKNIKKDQLIEKKNFYEKKY